MEENKNKNRKVVDGSVVLSFVVAIFCSYFTSFCGI